jgi:cytochrome c553
MPRLAKQRVDYMIHAMKEFRDNKRPAPIPVPTANQIRTY